MTSQQTVTINTTSVTGTQISLDFKTPNGNQPSSYENTVYIWQSGNQVPWSTTALHSQRVQSSGPDGSLSFDNLDVTNLSYIVGYAVGPIDSRPNIWSQYDNVVATVFIPAMNSSTLPENVQAGNVFSPSINVHNYGSTSLVANFAFPDGFNPGQSWSYVGIWEGKAASYTQPPKWVSGIGGSNASGTVSFNGIKILRGTSYTLGLYPTGASPNADSADLKRLAATYTFNN